MTAEYERTLLDRLVVIDYPAAVVARHAAFAAVCTITFAELSAGLPPDPLVNAAREQRYVWIVSTAAITFGPRAARTCGALCASARSFGSDPKPRHFDLLIAAWRSPRILPLLQSGRFSGNSRRSHRDTHRLKAQPDRGW
jgi:hypothetical protein